MSRRLRILSKGAFRTLLNGNQPAFMIIGAQKAGTSYLHYYLNQHPSLVGSAPKEMHYFDIEINHNRSLRWYEEHFKAFNSRSKQFFESTPSYLYYPRVAECISNLYPRIKFIVVLRNPVNRAFSAWNMYRHMFENNAAHMLKKEFYPGETNPIYKYLVEGRDKFPTFRQAIDIELQLMNTTDLIEPALLRRGLYFEQLSEYYKFFSRDQLLVIGFKDLVNQQNPTVNRIFQFLEVPMFDFSNTSSEAKNSGVYKSDMQDEDVTFLKKFYENPNKKLFDLLGYIPNW